MINVISFAIYDYKYSILDKFGKDVKLGILTS